VSTDVEVLRVEALMARGEYLAAYDAADEGAKSTSLNKVIRNRLAYLRALALARTGATERAGEEVTHLIEVEASATALDEDVWALKARVAKDAALAQSGEGRNAAAAVAAADYEAVYRRFGRPYACVNAATLWQVAGDDGRARALASQALRLAREPRTPPGEVYATHVFAAVLALETDAQAIPEYVGILTTAKDFETAPIYVLKPKAPRSAQLRSGQASQRSAS
jgi:hypothetical protein